MCSPDPTTTTPAASGDGQTGGTDRSLNGFLAPEPHTAGLDGAAPAPVAAVIDAEVSARSMARGALESLGFAVKEAEHGPAGVRLVFRERPDLVIVDLAVPDGDGWWTLGRIRELSESLPILVVSRHNTPADRVRTFGAGADDFLAKPFLVTEFIARARALLRRAALSGRDDWAHAAISTSWLHIDPARHIVRAGGTTVRLSPREFRLLLLLARRAGTVVTQDEIIRHLWGDVGDVDVGGALSVLVSRLRARLGSDPRLERSPVETVRGVGYRLAD